jgi:hypothetical protein
MAEIAILPSVQEMRSKVCTAGDWANPVASLHTVMAEVKVTDPSQNRTSVTKLSSDLAPYSKTVLK